MRLPDFPADICRWKHKPQGQWRDITVCVTLPQGLGRGGRDPEKVPALTAPEQEV